MIFIIFFPLFTYFYTVKITIHNQKNVEFASILYMNITNQALGAALENIGPRSWQYGPTKGQYSPVWLELASLVSSLLYGTWTMLVLNLPAFENKKYTADDRFHGNGPYGEILTKKEPIRMLGFTLPYIKFG